MSRNYSTIDPNLGYFLNVKILHIFKPKTDPNIILNIDSMLLNYSHCVIKTKY